jgi:hypothetical protein
MFLKATSKKFSFLDTMKKVVSLSPEVAGDHSHKLSRARFMTPLDRIVIKLIYGCIQPRESDNDTISWDHKHLALLNIHKFHANMTSYIFNYLCKNIKEDKKTILYGRLLFKLFYQSRLI